MTQHKAQHRTTYKASLTSRHGRGAAEVETVLVLPILITLLLLAVSLFWLGTARIANTAKAEREAYQQVIAGTTLNQASLQPPVGIDAKRAGFVTRYDEYISETQVTLG